MVGPVTLVVLVLGVLLEAFHQSFGKVEHASVFLVFYIPLFMLGSQWGATWSLNALLARRAGRATTSPTDDSWRHALPMRVTLLVLVLLFLMRHWPGRTRQMADGARPRHRIATGQARRGSARGLARACDLAVRGYPPAALGVAPTRGALFEALVVLVLLDGRLRAAYLAAALVFHALNALLLVVTFTPILIVYALFVDWQGMVEQLRRACARSLAS